MKVAVVGMGAIGAQALWQLSRADGVEVHGYDTGYVGHPDAGSGGDSRLFWNLELAEPGYVPLIRRAAIAWQRLESASGVALRDQTGVLLIGEEDNAQLTLARASADPENAPVELLDAGELKRRYPQFQLDDRAVGVWDIQGAAIRPELTNQVTARLAAQNGAVIHEFSRVTRIDHTSDTVTVVTDAGAEVYDRIVVACGGWTTQLVPELRHDIVTRRLTSVWFAAEDDGYLAGMPPFLRTAPNYTYGIPGRDGRSVKLGLGFNDHHVTGDPDTLRRALTGDELAEQIAKFDWVRGQMLPGLHRRPYRVSTFVESYTRSMMEYVRPHPDSDNIIVMAGFSGHGFRVAPAMGEIAAELVLTGGSTSDLAFLAAAEPAFEILDPDTGLATHNAVMASAGSAPGSGARV